MKNITYNGKSISFQPVCGPYSVSVITGVEFHKVMNYWRKTFNKDGRWKGRSTVRQCMKAIENLKNVRLVEFDEPRGTLLSWVGKHTMPHKTYFIRVGRHFVTYKGGEIHDQTESKPVSKHWSRNKRVTHAYEVKISKPKPKTKEGKSAMIIKTLSAKARNVSNGRSANICLDVTITSKDVELDVNNAVREWENKNNNEYRVEVNTNSNEYFRFSAEAKVAIA